MAIQNKRNEVSESTRYEEQELLNPFQEVADEG
jgi:hypothetical protein